MTGDLQRVTHARREAPTSAAPLVAMNLARIDPGVAGAAQQTADQPGEVVVIDDDADTEAAGVASKPSPVRWGAGDAVVRGLGRVGAFASRCR